MEKMKFSENMTCLGNSGFKHRSWKTKQNTQKLSCCKSNGKGNSGDLLIAFGISYAALKGFLFLFYVYLLWGVVLGVELRFYRIGSKPLDPLSWLAGP